MGKITQTEPMKVEEITVQTMNGIVNTIEQSNASSMYVTLTLNGHEETPVSIEFSHARHDTESPIKIGDWLTITTKVERLT